MPAPGQATEEKKDYCGQRYMMMIFTLVCLIVIMAIIFSAQLNSAEHKLNGIEAQVKRMELNQFVPVGL